MSVKDILTAIGATAAAGIVATASIVLHKNKNVVKQKSSGDNSPNSSVINDSSSTHGRQSKAD